MNALERLELEANTHVTDDYNDWSDWEEQEDYWGTCFCGQPLSYDDGDFCSGCGSPIEEPDLGLPEHLQTSYDNYVAR